MTHKPATLSVEYRPQHSPHRMFLKGTGQIYFIQERKTGAARGCTPRWLGFNSDEESTMREIARRWNAYPRLVADGKAYAVLLKHYIARGGPCEHDVGICVCDEIQAAEQNSALLRELGEE
jgi:hypothetical protein